MTDPHSDQPPLETLTRIQVLSAMGITAIVLLLISRFWLAIDGVLLLKVQWSVDATLIGVGLGLGITAASSLAYWLWQDYRNSADFYLNLVLHPLVWLDLIWLGLLPGLSEELLFRGVMLSAFGLNSAALLISSVCFGVLHFSGSQHWSYVVWATVIGFVLGYSALLTGNLLVPILAHVVTNWVSSCVWKWSLEHQKS